MMSVSIFVVVFVLALPALYYFQSLNFSWGRDIISGERGWSNISSIIDLGNVRRELDKQSQINLQQDRLPAEWVNIIKETKGTVDVLPWEITYCPANDLKWNPSPVLQTYSAYTHYLDQRNAQHYEGISAPEFLIIEFQDIDGRHPLLGTPDTWRHIISNYDLILQDSGTSRLLLRKKTQPSQENALVISQDKSRTNEWISVPPSNDLLFVDVDMRLTFWGTGIGYLYRIPPVYIDLIYDSGKAMSYRIIPTTAKGGLLTNFLPSNAVELGDLLKGAAKDRVSQFRIYGPGTIYYSEEINLTWEEISYPIKVQIDRLNPQELTSIGEYPRFPIDAVNNLLRVQ